MNCSLTVDSRQHFKNLPFKLIDCPSNLYAYVVFFLQHVFNMCNLCSTYVFPQRFLILPEFFVAEFVSYDLASLTFVFTLSYFNSEMNSVLDREVYFELYQIWCF